MLQRASAGEVLLGFFIGVELAQGIVGSQFFVERALRAILHDKQAAHSHMGEWKPEVEKEQGDVHICVPEAWFVLLHKPDEAEHETTDEQELQEGEVDSVDTNLLIFVPHGAWRTRERWAARRQGGAQEPRCTWQRQAADDAEPDEALGKNAIVQHVLPLRILYRNPLRQYLELTHTHGRKFLHPGLKGPTTGLNRSLGYEGGFPFLRVRRVLHASAAALPSGAAEILGLDSEDRAVAASSAITNYYRVLPCPFQKRRSPLALCFSAKIKATSTSDGHDDHGELRRWALVALSRP